MNPPDNVGFALDLSLWILSAVCFCVGLFVVIGGLRKKD